MTREYPYYTQKRRYAIKYIQGIIAGARYAVLLFKVLLQWNSPAHADRVCLCGIRLSCRLPACRRRSKKAKFPPYRHFSRTFYISTVDFWGHFSVLIKSPNLRRFPYSLHDCPHCISKAIPIGRASKHSYPNRKCVIRGKYNADQNFSTTMGR